MTIDIQYAHLVIFTLAAVAAWSVVTYLWPRMLLYGVYRRALGKGFGDGPIPMNTLYTESEKLFAEPLASRTAASSNLMTVGVNRDTLLTVGWLDLSKGPLRLHVPGMSDRYYSVQFTDPSNNTNFAYVGTRTTGTKAGDYVITGPRWNGQLPSPMARVSSPNNSVIVIARVFVESNADLATAYGLSRQIQLVPF